MTKFKVGDIVRLKEDLVLGEMYKHLVLTRKMKKRFTKPSKIVYMSPHAVKVEDNPFYYSFEMLEKVEEKKMENVKSLLKSGDTVVFGDGRKAKVLLDYKFDQYVQGTGIFAYFSRYGSFMSIARYHDDLKPFSGDEDYEVVKIYRPKGPGVLMEDELDRYNLIWERKEVKEMTMEEICKALGYEVKIKKED